MKYDVICNKCGNLGRQPNKKFAIDLMETHNELCHKGKTLIEGAEWVRVYD